MRSQSAITSDISSAEIKLDRLSGKLKKANKDLTDKGLDVWRGYRTFIYIILGFFSFFMMQVVDGTALIPVFVILIVFTPILAFIGSIRYAKGAIGYGVCVLMTCFSVVGIIAIVIGLIISAPVFVEEDVPIYDSFSVLGMMLFAVPLLIVMISSIVKSSKLREEHNKLKASIKTITDSIPEVEKKIKDLNAELNKTLEEAKRLYDSEIKKSSPAMSVMKQAADSGCPDAALWVARELASSLFAEKDNTEADIVANTSENIQHYVKLAKDCSDKDMRDVLEIWLWAYARQCSFSYYSTSEETVKELKTKSERISKLAMSNSEKVRVFANDIKQLLISAAATAESDFKKAEEERKREEEEKKREMSSAVYYSPPSYYKNGEPLTRSEIESLDREITIGLYNPTAIDYRTDLTEEQKDQIKDYNRIYGD